ncbi:MAG: ferritin-like domain-containing protein [Deltaproteobacteria bacterium]|nr:ferritin-like domain-containing protein [Deltaproteobacteria bacterium]
MFLVDLQRRAVDSIKRHALTMSLGSPRAQAAILTEYLWGEEGAESSALQKTAAVAAPAWLGKLVTRQLADEQRHASLLRNRLAELGAEGRPPPALAKAKLWWLERAVAPYAKAFSAGPIVIMLAVAAQLEATGVRVFGRHLAVLEQHAATDPLAEIVRSILADEQRHARSCAAAVEKLVHTHERAALAELRERIATVDRAFGITIAVGYWLLIAARVLRDRTGAA